MRALRRGADEYVEDGGDHFVAVEMFRDPAVDLRFATSLVMRAEVEAGTCAADILISPAPVQAAFAAAGHTVPGSAIRLGAIRAGVVVHRDARPRFDRGLPSVLPSVPRASG